MIVAAEVRAVIALPGWSLGGTALNLVMILPGLTVETWKTSPVAATFPL
jgi:hypothetical protein